MSWSLKGIEKICEGSGFKVLPIRGKTWAFAIEFESNSSEFEDITHRIWTPLEENLKVLTDSKTGSVLKILGFEASRAYFNRNMFYDFIHMIERLFKGLVNYGN